MKFKLLFIAVTLLLLFYSIGRADVQPRPIFASSIYNGSGILNVPNSTPFAHRASIFDNNNTLSSSVTTDTELSYVHGVTSAIQTQINNIVAGTANRTTNTVSTSITVPTLTRDYLLNVDTTGSALTEILPDAVASNSLCIDIKNIGSPAQNINILTQGGQTIDRASNLNITSDGDSNHICAVNSQWWIY